MKAGPYPDHIVIRRLLAILFHELRYEFRGLGMKDLVLPFERRIERDHPIPIL